MPEWEVYFAWCMNICGMRGSLHRVQEHSSFCTEELITAAPSPPPPPPPLSPSEEITTVHPRCILISQNASHILISCLLFSPLLPPHCFSHPMEAKIGPAAFLWPFCPCSGRRLAHRGSCYNFHFLNISLFFSSPVWNQDGYFIPLRSATMTGEGSKMAARIRAAVTPTLADK